MKSSLSVLTLFLFSSCSYSPSNTLYSSPELSFPQPISVARIDGTYVFQGAFSPQDSCVLGQHTYK